MVAHACTCQRQWVFALAQSLWDVPLLLAKATFVLLVSLLQIPVTSPPGTPYLHYFHRLLLFRDICCLLNSSSHNAAAAVADPSNISSRHATHTLFPPTTVSVALDTDQIYILLAEQLQLCYCC